MRLLSVSVLLGTLLAVAGCGGGDPNENLQASIVPVAGTSVFDPGNGLIPFPNNLLFQGSLDGTLNIPVADPDDLSDPQVALNALDGFSTVAPFSTGFTTALDPASVNGNSVRVFQVELLMPGGPVDSVTRELTYGVEFIATVASTDPDGQTLAIVPLVTLAPKSSYYVVITNSLRAASGGAIAASTVYTLTKGADPLHVGGVSQVPVLSDAEAQALEPLRLLTNTSELTTIAVAAPALTQPEIILSWSFTTQSTSDVLSQVRSNILSGAVPASLLVDSGVDSPLGAADIYVGSLAVPYYLTVSSGVNDPTALFSYWQGVGGSNLTQYNPSPVATSTQNIPLMASLPKAPCPASNCPVVIFQHGITANRASMLAVADSMAQAGFAVVAIDAPMHGITGNETNGTQAFKDTVNGERTFDLDLVTQDADGNITAPLPDGITDSSGVHYINLANLLNSRDNVRQAVSDLFTLTYALGGMSAGGNTFDTGNVYFMGHSLGGIVGVTFLAIEPDSSVKDAVIAMGGGGIAKLLDGSAAFGPAIAAGLAAKGVIKGTSDYESFMGAAQTAMDSGDPINFAAASTANRGILFLEVVGGGGVPSDLVVPNRVPDGNDISGTVPGPLSGTDPLVSVDLDVPNPGLGLTQYDSTQAASNLLALVRFIAGNHSSVLSPGENNVNLAVTVEMQTEAATFLGSDLASGGLVNQLLITNNSVIAAP